MPPRAPPRLKRGKNYFPGELRGSVDNFSEAEKGIVVFDPVADGDGAVFLFAAADDHLVNTGVDNLALAHGAAHGVLVELTVGFPAHKVQCGADHVPAGGGDDGVGLGVDRAAELVAFAGGDFQLLTHAAAQVRAVLATPGCAVVAGGDYLVVAHNDGAVFFAQAGGAVQHCVGNVKVVILFVGSVVAVEVVVRLLFIRMSSLSAMCFSNMEIFNNKSLQKSHDLQA